jgi:hypothetical protein
MQTTETSRLQLELREDTWIAPGLTAAPWPTSIRHARPSATEAPIGLTECSCPVDCPRDHETD